MVHVSELPSMSSSGSPGHFSPDAIRADLQLLIAVGTFWGLDALKLFTFTEVPKSQTDSSRFASLLQPFRHSV